MSFVITVYVREGIVMAADSRLTLNNTQQQNGQQIIQMSVGQSDSTNKLFLTHNNVGIATFGDASVGGVPIGGVIESFINDHLSQGSYEVDQIPQELLNYFRNMQNIPDAIFLVAGYKLNNDIPEQHVWEVNLVQNRVNRVNTPDTQGAKWGGETDVMTRLIQSVYIMGEDNNYHQLPHYNVYWQYFTLQDAIDFCNYAVKATIDTMRFLPRPKTVGGPIDILVIKSNEALWIARKELHL